MKHLKNSQEFLHGGTYIRIDDEEFYNDRDRLKETSRVDYFTLEELKWFEDKGIYSLTDGDTTKDTKGILGGDIT